MKNRKMKIIAKILLMGLFACLGLEGKAQEVVTLENYGKVSVNYMLVSEKYPDGIQIKNLPGEQIDIAQNPNAEIRIKIKVLNLDNGYRIHICPTCVLYELNGFRRTQSIKRYLRKKNDSVTAYYEFDEKYIGENKSSVLRVSIYVERGNVPVGEETGYHSNGQKFKLVTETAARPAEAKVNAEEEAVSPSVETGPTDHDKIAWDEADNCARRENQIYQKIACYQDYLQQFGAGKYADEARERIKHWQNEERKWAEANGGSPSAKKADKSPKKKDIASEFSIREVDQEDLGDTVKITLEFLHSDGQYPTLSGDSRIRKVKLEGQMRMILYIPKGIGEQTLTAIMTGVQFTGTNNEYTVDTAYGPLKAQFLKAGDGAIQVDIMGGKPPYNLRFLSGGIVEKIIQLEKNQSFTLKKEHTRSMPPGEYTLQVYDATGNNVEAARWNEGTLTISWWTASTIFQLLFWPLLFLLAGGGIYYMYNRFQKEDRLSTEDTQKIQQKISIGRSGPEPEGDGGMAAKEKALPAKPRAEGADDIRKRITVKKKASPSALDIAPAALANGYPRLKEVEESEAPEILLGEAKEYRRADMSDLWEDSYVSDIFIRDVVAYRINRFVFEENKSMLEGRGEQVPEIGGWIMGRQAFDAGNDKYIVSFERFIQLHRPKDKSTTQLVFGTDAWQALEKAKDIYREEGLEMVGWFHTHPGWGVFLSHDDINTHETHFQEPYHIAMELESVCEPYDVGFFSRKKERGRLVLNNRARAYYKWKEFSDWAGGRN